MRVGVGFGLAVLAASLAGGCAPDGARPAPPPEARDAVAPASPGTGATCTFDVRDYPIGDMIHYVERAAGDVRILVSPEAAEVRISLRVRNLAWRSALAEVAREGGCSVEEAPDGLRLVLVPDAVGTLTGTCTFAVEGMPIDDVLDRVRTAAGGVRIVLSPLAAEERVTLEVRRAPWRDALAGIVSGAGCTVEERPDHLRVAKAPPAALEDLKVRVARCGTEGGAHRVAAAGKDYLGMAASKHAFRREVARLDACLEELRRESPEFGGPELRERLAREVVEPLERLRKDHADLLGGK